MSAVSASNRRASIPCSMDHVYGCFSTSQYIRLPFSKKRLKVRFLTSIEQGQMTVATDCFHQSRKLHVILRVAINSSSVQFISISSAELKAALKCNDLALNLRENNTEKIAERLQQIALDAASLDSSDPRAPFIKELPAFHVNYINYIRQLPDLLFKASQSDDISPLQRWSIPKSYSEFLLESSERFRSELDRSVAEMKAKIPGSLSFMDKTHREYLPKLVAEMEVGIFPPDFPDAFKQVISKDRRTIYTFFPETTTNGYLTPSVLPFQLLIVETQGRLPCFCFLLDPFDLDITPLPIEGKEESLMLVFSDSKVQLQSFVALKVNKGELAEVETSILHQRELRRSLKYLVEVFDTPTSCYFGKGDEEEERVTCFFRTPHFPTNLTQYASRRTLDIFYRNKAVSAFNSLFAFLKKNKLVLPNLNGDKIRLNREGVFIEDVRSVVPVGSPIDVTKKVSAIRKPPERVMNELQRLRAIDVAQTEGGVLSESNDDIDLLCELEQEETKDNQEDGSATVSAVISPDLSELRATEGHMIWQFGLLLSEIMQGSLPEFLKPIEDATKSSQSESDLLKLLANLDLSELSIADIFPNKGKIKAAEESGMDSFLNAFLKRVTYQCLLDVEHRISLPTLIKALSFYKEMHALKGSLPVPHDQIELTLNLSRDFESLVRGGLSAVAKAKKQKALREERRRFRRRSFY